MSPNRGEDFRKSKWAMREESYQELIQMIERFLDLNRWGFNQVYSFFSEESPPCVIYESQLCKVKFNIAGGERYSGPELFVYYGRLHAPNGITAIMTWMGEKCWAWHSVDLALNFLDGLSPQQAFDQAHVKHQWWPDVPTHFMQSEVAQKISPDSYPSPELAIRLHAAIWEYYGQRLFELFDLHRPDLWERYTRFIMEYYRTLNIRNAPGLPPPEKIC